MRGVVLLDLPDHDSTEVSHHLEVDRLVQLADLMVWVLDPQKYADAAVHDRYLAPLATHREVMLVVLNHVDTVPAGRLESMLADVRRLLDADGLTGVPVIATSARTGQGMDELRARDRDAGRQEEGRPHPPGGRPARGGPADGRGDRHGAHAEAVEGARRRARRRARAVRRRTDRGQGRRGLHAPAGEPRHRLARRRLVLPPAARPAEAAAPRPRLLRQGALGPCPHLRPGSDHRPAGPRRLRGADAGRRRVQRPVAVVEPGRARGIAVAARRPQRRARPGARGDRARRGPDPGVGRARPGPPVAAAAGGAGRGGLARRDVRDPLPDVRDAGDARDRRLPAAAARCSSAASCSASCSRCSAGSWCARPRAGVPARPTDGCGPRSPRSPTSSSSSPCRTCSPATTPRAGASTRRSSSRSTGPVSVHSRRSRTPRPQGYVGDRSRCRRRGVRSSS